MHNILVICGPTGTGKTALGLSLCKKINGEIISADSRQVYKGMDIGTGKEWGEGVKIWGYDLVDPKKEFSVSHFLKFAEKAIEDIESRGKTPVVVGGTGLYIKAIIDGIPTIDVPVNDSLRKNLSKKTTDELYETLSQMDGVKAASLNSSDKKNPRRLIRAIEIANYKLQHGDFVEKISNKQKSNILVIGLKSTKDILEKRVDKKVDERVVGGQEKEISKLLKSGVDWNNQSMTSIGYCEWRDYFEGGVEKERIIEEWKKDEKKYVARQMTWFKKDKRVKWFDIDNQEYPTNVEKIAQKWYSTAIKQDA